MLTALWGRLWTMHYDTKETFAFTPKAMQRMLGKKGIRILERRTEQDVDLADEMDEAPAEHANRLKSTPGGINEGEPQEYTKRQKIGLALGPALFLLMLLSPTPTAMSANAQKMAAVALLMATWWMCESIPIPATSLLPIALFPIMGIMKTQAATAPYASHLIFLFIS